MRKSIILIVATLLPGALVAASCAGAPESEPQSGEEQLAAGGPRGGPGFGRGTDRRVAELTEALALSEQQAVQIRAIFEEEGPAAGAGRGPDAWQARGEMRDRIHARIVAVLTPEQAAKLEQLPIERRLQHLTARLALDEQQVAQIRTILQETFAQGRQLRAQGPESADARQAHQALRQQTQERIAAVLNAEQRATFEQVRDERGFGGGRGHHGRWGRHGRGHGGPGGPGGFGPGGPGGFGPGGPGGPGGFGPGPADCPGPGDPGCLGGPAGPDQDQ